MPDDRTIQGAWEEFWGFVKPDEYPKDQYDDMEMSFYAGAWTILTIMLNIPKDISLDGGANILEGLRVEAESYLLKRTIPITGKPN